MPKTQHRYTLKQRSAWVASMVACFAFLLMAIKVYQVSLSTIAINLLLMLIGLLLIVALAALLGWLLAVLRERKP